MIESYRADAFYDAMRCKGHLLRRYHSLTCEPCKRVFKDSRVCKTSKIKRDPDALDNLVEHFRSRKHAKTVSANLIMIAARILVALDGLSLARPSVTYRPHHIPTPSRPICQEPALPMTQPKPHQARTPKDTPTAHQGRTPQKTPPHSHSIPPQTRQSRSRSPRRLGSSAQAGMGPLRASDEGEGSESYCDGGGTPLASAPVDSMQQEQQMDFSRGEHDATILRVVFKDTEFDHDKFVSEK